MYVKQVAKVAVLNPRGEVLLLRRSPNDPARPGEWDFPGGGVEPHESLRQTVLRETREEAGLEIEGAEPHLAYTETTYTQDKDEVAHKFLYICRLAADATVRLSNEHDHFEWQSVDRTLDMFSHPFYNAGLRFAQEHNLL